MHKNQMHKKADFWKSLKNGRAVKLVLSCCFFSIYAVYSVEWQYGLYFWDSPSFFMGGRLTWKKADKPGPCWTACAAVPERSKAKCRDEPPRRRSWEGRLPDKSAPKYKESRHVPLKALSLPFLILLNLEYDRSRHASLKALTRSFSGVVLTPE